MAAAAAAANGTGGSSGMEVDAAGNGPCGAASGDTFSGCVKVFLGSLEKRHLLPGNLQEGCTASPVSAVLNSHF
jgi:hypothetical protein